MSIKATIISEIQNLAGEKQRALPPLTDDLLLLDSGLDSLALAILVARLEDALGFDPFSESEDVGVPVTLGDFIGLYERGRQSA
jgi:acyl carrier protein